MISDKTKDILLKILKLLRTSAAFVAGTAIVGVIYGFIAQGRFTLQYAYDACFAVGAFIVLVGLITMYKPVRKKQMGSELLIDHTTYAQKKREIREQNRIKGFGFLYMGLCIALIAGIVQIIHFYLF